MNLKALTEQKVEKQNEMEKLLDTDKTEKNVNLNYINEINELKKENEELKKENEELKKEIDELKKENESIKKEKNNYNKKLQETENFYKNIISENEKQITELTQNVEKLEKN